MLTFTLLINMLDSIRDGKHQDLYSSSLRVAESLRLSMRSMTCRRSFGPHLVLHIRQQRIFLHQQTSRSSTISPTIIQTSRCRDYLTLHIEQQRISSHQRTSGSSTILPIITQRPSGGREIAIFTYVPWQIGRSALYACCQIPSMRPYIVSFLEPPWTMQSCNTRPSRMPGAMRRLHSVSSATDLMLM